jgi:arginase
MTNGLLTKNFEHLKNPHSVFTRPFALLGVPLGFSGRRFETRFAPEVLRSKGLVDRLRIIDSTVVDLGNVAISTLPIDETRTSEGVRNLEVTTASLALTFERLSEVYAQGYRPIVIGGEHSISIASVAAARNFLNQSLGHEARLGILWVDAHADINSPKSSPSGNIHGMPLRVLLNEGPEILNLIGGVGSKIEPGSLVYIGLRDIDREERYLLTQRSIKVFSMREIDLVGIASVITQALKFLNERVDAFVVSFDIDVCDPLIAPGVGSTVRGGLTYRESHFLMEEISTSSKVLTLEMMEYCPSLDSSGETAELTIGLLESALGKRIL